MEQKIHNRKESEISETTVRQYSNGYPGNTEPCFIFFSLIVFVASVFILLSACKKDEEIIDENNSIGNVALLKVGVLSPLWSPDGKKIAYLMDGKLYVMNIDGSGDLLLTSEINELPKWSPTGTELAYIDYREYPAIYKIGVNGNNEVKLTSSAVSPFYFSWSPDGERIVYESSGIKQDMYIINKDGSGNHKVNIPINVSNPTFTPGGSKIMFRSGFDMERDIYLVGTDGSNLQRIALDNIYEEVMQMKSDESKIYFSGATAINWGIYEVNPDGSNLKNLTNGVVTNHNPNLSPNGKYIAFLSYRDDNDGLWLMHSDGSNPSRITKGDYVFFSGSWSPDSRKLVFDDEIDGVQGIYVLTLK
jgi:TolB protein